MAEVRVGPLEEGAVPKADQQHRNRGRRRMWTRTGSEGGIAGRY